MANQGRHSGVPMSFCDTYGREQTAFRMTAKGLSELAMGFTGDQSRVIRIRFLNAFEAVADWLAALGLALPPAISAGGSRSR